MKKFFLLFASFLLISILVVLGLFNWLWDMGETQIVQRLPSPDKKIVALLKERSGSNHLYLMQAGENELTVENPNFSSSPAGGVSLRWTSPAELEVTSDSKNIHHFSNVWVPTEDSRIRVQLRLAAE